MIKKHRGNDMFNEFIKCTEDKSSLEIVTIVCEDCTMQVTLEQLRNYTQAVKDAIEFYADEYLPYVKDKK